MPPTPETKTRSSGQVWRPISPSAGKPLTLPLKGNQHGCNAKTGIVVNSTYLKQSENGDTPTDSGRELLWPRCGRYRLSPCIARLVCRLAELGGRCI